MEAPKDGTIAIDPESQQPIQATDVRPADQVPPRIVYVGIVDPGPSYNEFREEPGQPDPRALCAALGLAFSWIPIVGFITFFVNLDAPRGTPRHSFATAACAISSFVVLFNIIFWMAVAATY